jgi:RNA polymerase sigma factor for flagellar operon FliA
MPIAREQSSTTGEEQLIRQHLPLVQHVVASARGRIPSHVHVDDLTSAAMTGLFRAARAFQEDRGVPFAAYATTRIRGAILDELRGADWASRNVRAKARSLQEATAVVGGDLREAAAAVGISEHEARQVAADVQRANPLSLDGLLVDDHGGGPLPADDTTPEGALVDRERIGYLRDAVDLLPERLRHVVVGFFFEERSMAELAADLGVTESRISHMRAEAMSLLHEALDRALADEDDGPAVTEPATGVAARRRAAYCATVASASDYRNRLDRPAPLLGAIAAASA